MAKGSTISSMVTADRSTRGNVDRGATSNSVGGSILDDFVDVNHVVTCHTVREQLISPNTGSPHNRRTFSPHHNRNHILTALERSSRADRGSLTTVFNVDHRTVTRLLGGLRTDNRVDHHPSEQSDHIVVIDLAGRNHGTTSLLNGAPSRASSVLSYLGRARVRALRNCLRHVVSASSSSLPTSATRSIGGYRLLVRRLGHEQVPTSHT